MAAANAESAIETADDARSGAGARLFFAKELSRDGSVACADCHSPKKAYSDGRSTSIGIDAQRGSRNAPSLLTSRFETSLFWDGRRDSLEALVLDPILSSAEMGMGEEARLIARIRQTPALRDALARTFGTVDVAAVRGALATYIRRLPLRSNAYDRFRADPRRFPLSAAAARGENLFNRKADCASCHRSDGKRPLLSDDAMHHSAIGWERVENALPSLTADVLASALDGVALSDTLARRPPWAALGHFVASHDPKDLGAFRTPSLRNVALTAPYMHDGSVATLADAVDLEIYYRSLSSGRAINLTVAERNDLVEFLGALSESEDAPVDTSQ